MYGGPDALIAHGRGRGAGFALVIHGRTREALLQVVDTLGIACTDEDVNPPGEVPEPLEELGPFALADGDTDDRWRWRWRWRWRVESTGSSPAAATVPASLRALPDRTAAALDEDATVAAAGDAEGRVHVGESTAEAVADGPSTAVSKPLHRAPLWPAAWADGLVRIWDLGSRAVARLHLGTGITDLALESDGTLYVTGPSGRPVALRLDTERLWPHRALQLRLDDVGWGSYWSGRGPAHAVPGLIRKATTSTGCWSPSTRG
ncbi:hypothetical protein [Streptomyces sp. NPDC090445]|uniref:hypothetical protein n=1 Tax=Streptomyces sp. NPDC090445 TaxID=3365963 RepID=UPI00380BF214